jgi:hypothetical protein
MILDGFLQFDPTETSVAIAAGTQASTNIIDLHMLGIPVLANGQGARDMGIGDDPALKLVVQVSTSFASAGSTGTISASFQGAPDNGSGAPGTYTTYLTGPALVIPAAGARLLNIDWPRPPAGTTFPRFVRLLYTVAVQTMTAGKLGAWAVLDRDDQPQLSATQYGGYPAGITVNN